MGPNMHPLRSRPDRPRHMHEHNPPPTTGQTHTCPDPLDLTYGQLAHRGSTTRTSAPREAHDGADDEQYGANDEQPHQAFDQQADATEDQREYDE